MNIIKKGLMVVCAVFCLFGIAACKDDEEPTKVEMTKQQFYEKLLVLNSKMNNEKQYTISGETSATTFMVGKKTSYKISVDLDNNKYANVEKDKKGNTTKSEFVINNGNDYIKYTYEKDYFDDDYTYGSYYVGNDYVAKTMGFNENMIDISELDMTSYEKFCESFDKMLVENRENLEGLNLESLDTKVEQYIENNVYHFVYGVSYSASEDGIEFSVNIEAVMKFNDDFMISTDMEVSMNYDIAEGTMSMQMKNSNQYSKGFDDSIIPTDFSAYPQDIENTEFEVYYVLDGKEDLFGEDYVYTPNGIFIPDYSIEEIDNAYVDGWYLDKECTISVNTLTEYPSYDLYLYANTKPNENYALIILEETVTTADDWTLGPIVTKQAIEAGSEFVLPTELDVYGIEGTVDNITVDGVSYNESTLTVESGKVYRINVSATEINN